MIEKNYVCRIISQYFTEAEKDYAEEYRRQPTRLNAMYLARERENRYAVEKALARFDLKYGDRGSLYGEIVSLRFGKHPRSVVSLSMEYCLSESAIYVMLRDLVRMTAEELGIKI